VCGGGGVDRACSACWRCVLGWCGRGPFPHVQQLVKGKLSKSLFPFAGAEMPAVRMSSVIVFIIGGVTYEEAAKVAALNATEGHPRVILGGTMVLNSKKCVGTRRLAALRGFDLFGVDGPIGPRLTGCLCRVCMCLYVHV
jgi:hypothetical protein